MSENTLPPTPPTDPAVPAQPATKPRRRLKRRLLIGVLALPVFAGVGILLLPTILSLGPVRSLAMSIAGPKVAPNGSLKIDSWSFGWFGGQKINGITLFDDQNAAVAHLNIETGASLFALARGDLDLKHTTVTGDFDVRIDPVTNRVNVLHVLGADSKPAATTTTKPNDDKPKGEPKATEPIKVPDVKGTVHVAMSGTVSSTNADDKRIPFTKIEKADLDVDLSDIDKGVGLNGTIRATIDGKPASIVVNGTVDAIENHVVIASDLDKLGAKLDLSIEQLDLAVVKVALAAQAAMTRADAPAIDVAGLLRGKIAVDVVPGGAATVTSDALGIDGLTVATPQLKGDVLALKRVDFPLSVTRDASTKLYTIKSTGIRSDLATVDIAGTLPELAIQNYIDHKPPGATGRIVVTSDVPNLAAVQKMLPNTIPPPQGVTVTGGGLHDVTTVNVLADGAKLDTSLKVDAKGTRDGKPITIEPTTLNASADYAIHFVQPADASLPPAIDTNLRNVRQMAIDLAAPFATVKGGGVPTKLQLDGKLDLTRLFDDVAQFVDFAKASPALDGLDLKGQTTFTLSTDGDPTDLSKAIDAKLSFNTTELTAATKAKSYVDGEAIKGDVDVLYKQANHAKLVTFNKLSVSSSDSLIGLWTAGDTAWVSIPDMDADGKPLGNFGGRGEFHLRTTKLDRLVAIASTQPADAGTRVTRGVVDSIVTLASDADGASYSIATKTDVTKLDVGKLLSNEMISVSSNTSLPASVATAKSTFDVASRFANVKGDADLMLKDGEKTPSTFAMVRSANFSGDVPSLAKLYGLKEAMSPSKPVIDTATGKTLPPMTIEGGSLAFNGKVTRDDSKNLSTLRLDVPGIKDLRLARGEQSFSPGEPITLTFSTDLTTNDNAPNPDPKKASILDNVDRAIASIELNAPGLATAKTTTPIDVGGLKQPTPIAKGVLHATASLGPVFKLLTVVSGSPPKPIEGDFATDQTLATSGNAINVSGTGKLTKLTPIGPDAKPLPPQLQTIDLADDVSLDLSDAKSTAMTISKIDVIAPDARDALSLNVVGKLRELGTNNDIDNVVAKVRYDLPQLWPIVQPIVDPTGESIGKIDGLAGKYEKTFAVSGSYPTARADGTVIPFNESIRTLVVNGDVQLDKATLSEKGIDLANVSLPISLEKGIAHIAFADGKPPKPMTLNSGTADLGGISVNLAGAEPILGNLKDKQIVKGATLNPLLSNALGKYFNPIFPNATKATAVIELVLSTSDLHLGPSLTTAKSGKAVAVLSLTDMEIANPLSENLLGGVVNQVSKYTGQSGVDTKDISELSGEMKDATFTLDRGVVTQDATFMIGNKGAVDDKGKPKRYAFNFAGDVQLSNLAMNLTAGFPVALLKDKLKGDAAQILSYAPDNLKLGLTGTTSAPKLDTSAFSKTFTEAFAKFGTQKLLGGKGDKNGDADDGKKSDKQKIGDLIGGLLGDKKNENASPPADRKQSADDNDDAPKKKKKKKGDDN